MSPLCHASGSGATATFRELLTASRAEIPTTGRRSCALHIHHHERFIGRSISARTWTDTLPCQSACVVCPSVCLARVSLLTFALSPAHPSPSTPGALTCAPASLLPAPVSYLNKFYCKETLLVPNYALIAPLPTYYIPDNVPLQQYKVHGGTRGGVGPLQQCKVRRGIRPAEAPCLAPKKDKAGPEQVRPRRFGSHVATRSEPDKYFATPYCFLPVTSLPCCNIPHQYPKIVCAFPPLFSTPSLPCLSVPQHLPGLHLVPVVPLSPAWTTW